MFLDYGAGAGIREQRRLYGLQAQRCRVLSDGSNGSRRVVSHARCLNTGFADRGSIAQWPSLGRGKWGRPRRANPVDRLPDEGDSEIDAPSYLRRKFFESFGPKRAGSPLLARRHQRGHGQMEPGVKSGGLIRDPEIAIELLELAAQSGEVARHS